MRSQSHIKDDFSVSVIIPTYNRILTLPRALDSVLNQSRPAEQIIVIDDGSSDHTAELIRDSYPNVHYHYQTNKGVSQARNTGIKLAKSNWIAFLDSDDEWLPKKLENQIRALRQHPEYQICHSNERWIRRGRRVNPKIKHQKYGGHIYLKCLPLCVISPSSVLIHRILLGKFGHFDETLPVCEDYDLWLRICAYRPVLYLQEPQIIKYGGDHDQLSAKYWGIDRFRIRALEKILQNPDLNGEYRIATLKMLIHKISIYLNGAKKRSKSAEIRIYSQKLADYRQMLKTTD